MDDAYRGHYAGDPAQNHTFRDHYLEVDLDLSDVLFLATANVVDTVPGPLLDRMELVTLDGYTEEEKVAIARDHLLPRQLERAGLTADEALGRIAAEHTREAGGTAAGAGAPPWTWPTRSRWRPPSSTAGRGRDPRG